MNEKHKKVIEDVRKMLRGQNIIHEGEWLACVLGLIKICEELDAKLSKSGK